MIVVPGVALFLVDSILHLAIEGLSHIFFYMLMYLLGYAIASTASTSIGDLTKKYKWVYLGLGLVFMSVYSVVFLATNELDNQKKMNQSTIYPKQHVNSQPLPVEFLLYLLSAFGSWTFVLGLVSIAKETFTSPKPVISKLREISMPFYINFQWLLNVYLAGAFWVPYLRSFPFTVILCSLITGVVSLLIRKSGSLGYFFGLRLPPNSLLPGEKMRGIIPATLLFVSFTICRFVLSFTKETVLNPTYMDMEYMDYED